MADELFSDAAVLDQRDDPFSGNLHSAAGPDDAPPRICKHDGCRNPIEWSGGAGRPPVYCEEHKNKRRTKDATTAPAIKTATPINTQNVAKKIENSLNAMGAMSATLLAARKDYKDATTLVKKVPPFAAALGAWGAESSRIAKMVSGGANVFASVTVLFTLFDLIWELLANHGLVPSPKTPASDGPVLVEERAA